MTAQLSGHFYLYHIYARVRVHYILYVKGGYYMQRGG